VDEIHFRDRNGKLGRGCLTDRASLRRSRVNVRCPGPEFDSAFVIRVSHVRHLQSCFAARLGGVAGNESDEGKQANTLGGVCVLPSHPIPDQTQGCPVCYGLSGKQSS